MKTTINLLMVLALLFGLVFTGPVQHVSAATASDTAYFEFTSSANPADYGQAVTFTLSATGTDEVFLPSGYVDFFADETLICDDVPLNDPQNTGEGSPATCAVSTLVSGVHVITAEFNSYYTYMYASETLYLDGGQTVGEPPTVTITPETLLDQVNGQYVYQFLYPDWYGFLTYEIIAGTLPPGIVLYPVYYENIDKYVGVLEGTLAATDTFNFTFTVGAYGFDGLLLGSRQYTWNVLTPFMTISPDTLLNAAYQTQYSQQLTVNGGYAPYTFSLLNGSLPNGITLSSSGLLSGYPSGWADTGPKPGEYPITVRVQDVNDNTVDRNYTFVLDKGTPTVIIYSSEFYWNYPFTLGAEVQMPTQDGGANLLGGTVAFKIGGTSVPGCEAVTSIDYFYSCRDASMGLSVDTDYTVEAVYTPTGWYADYYFPATGNLQITVKPNALNIQGTVFADTNQDGVLGESETTGLGDWTVNLDKGCDETVDFTVKTLYGGLYAFYSIPSGYEYCITAEAQPGWQQTTPPLAGFLLAENTFGKNIGFYYPTITLNPSDFYLPDGTVGLEYSQTFTASGGTEPYIYTISDGELPPGLTLSEKGVLSGTPTAAGGYNFAVRAEDATQAAGKRSYYLTIHGIRVDGNFTFTSSSNPSTKGEAVTFTLSATGEAFSPDLGQIIPPVGFVTFLADGTPIEGCSDLFLNLDQVNLIPGDYPASCTTAALSVGSHEIKAVYTDATRLYNDATLTLTQLVGPQKVTPAITVLISTPTYWGHPFNLNAIVIANNTYVAGSVDFAIDGEPVAVCQDVGQDENDHYFCQGVSLTPAVGEHTLTASFTPTDVDTYNPVSGSIPFTVQPGSYQIQGNVFEDQDQDSVLELGEYGIWGWTISLTTCDGNPVVRENGTEITPQVSSYDGWFLFTGVPGGQCIHLSEVVQPGWQPTTPEQLVFTLSQDAHLVKFGNYYPTITLSPSNYDLPGGNVGEAYSPITFIAAGGTGPYTYTITYGDLPNGMELSADGVLSGTPTLAGGFHFSVQAEDQDQAVGDEYYSIAVLTDGTFTLTSSSNPSASGEVVTFTLEGIGEAFDPYYREIIPPSGLVTFQADGVDIEGCTAMDLNFDWTNYTYGNYPAICTTSALGPGTHNIQAIYTDATGYFRNATLTLTQEVQGSVAAADLSISKTDKTDPVKPGARLDYTLVVSNTGPDAAQNLILVDTLDRNTTFVSVTAPKGWTCSYAEKSGKVTCTVASLASGGSATIKITVTVNKTAKVGKDLVNNASISSETYDPDLLNNSVVEKTLVKK